ncbi:reverse transcriptase family protein [Nocardioides pocheonensis]|uniref:RNA-directed DNA polymerase n=1 Tax=Nocardioides pocheonensis TaxID=661485 RepID=A0A3N0GY10_9ACTN|nr:reverse transcriptase family protein [Nocardioides pocheonensis]RNM17365.1 RNA-directed DNA polymerase [Nocardioides pocheonensis]
MIDLADLGSASALDADEFIRWSNLIAAGSGYSRMSIPQRRRRPRVVLRPEVALDRFLKQLTIGLSRISGYMPPAAVHGFVTGRDIATNAAVHLDQDVVLRVDLKDFFGTINEQRLVRALGDYEFDEDAADAVAGVALVNDALAQGFSTSPFLSNIVFTESDAELTSFAARAGVSYTRYVDDLTFSGPYESVNDELLEAASALLADLGWSVNTGKTRFMRRGKPQYVTGLYVGDSAGPHIPRSMKRLLRREVYFASKYGLRDARLSSPTPMLHDRLNGWVHYAAHVDPVFGKKLLVAWNDVASRRYADRESAEWDAILEDINFPEDW